MKFTQKNVANIFKKIQSLCSDTKSQRFCLEVKQKQYELIHNIIVEEDVWIAFFLPSELNLLKENKKKIIDCVGNNVYQLKYKVLNLINNQEKLKKISSSNNPLDKNNKIVLVMLLEIIIHLKQNTFSKEFIQENRQIWISLGDQFGLWKMRYILEDSIFLMLQPQEYYLIESLLIKELKIHQDLFKEIIEILKYYFSKAKLKKFEISYRKKNIFGIYQKIQNKGKNINHITDFFGFRVKVNTIDEYYQVLEILHYLWPPYPKRIKDYIKNPKSNQYQSLHTTLSCLNKQPVEFQIRTYQMDHIAKFGPASHALYKQKRTR